MSAKGQAIFGARSPLLRRLPSLFREKENHFHFPSDAFLHCDFFPFLDFYSLHLISQRFDRNQSQNPSDSSSFLLPFVIFLSKP